MFSSNQTPIIRQPQFANDSGSVSLHVSTSGFDASSDIATLEQNPIGMERHYIPCPTSNLQVESSLPQDLAEFRVSHENSHNSFGHDVEIDMSALFDCGLQDSDIEIAAGVGFKAHRNDFGD